MMRLEAAARISNTNANKEFKPDKWHLIGIIRLFGHDRNRQDLWGMREGNNLFRIYFFDGNNRYPIKNRERVSPSLKRPLLFDTDFISRHEEKGVIEPAVDVSLYNLIHISADSADQPDV